MLKELENIVDDGTTVVYVDTPDGWKCPRKGCTTDFKHTHSTYKSLIDSNKKGVGKYSSKNKRKANPITFYGQNAH